MGLLIKLLDSLFAFLDLIRVVILVALGQDLKWITVGVFGKELTYLLAQSLGRFEIFILPRVVLHDIHWVFAVLGRRHNLNLGFSSHLLCH